MMSGLASYAHPKRSNIICSTTYSASCRLLHAFGVCFLKTATPRQHRVFLVLSRTSIRPLHSGRVRICE